MYGCVLVYIYCIVYILKSCIPLVHLLLHPLIKLFCLVGGDAIDGFELQLFN